VGQLGFKIEIGVVVAGVVRCFWT